MFLARSGRHQQLQKRNEGEVDELEEHRAMLAELHGAGSQLRSEFWHPSRFLLGERAGQRRSAQGDFRALLLQSFHQPLFGPIPIRT
jgi:hypothetical protein